MFSGDVISRGSFCKQKSLDCRGNQWGEKSCCWPQQSAHINCWNMTNKALEFQYGFYSTFFLLKQHPASTHAGCCCDWTPTYSWMFGSFFLCFPETWSQRQAECIAALFSSVSWMTELGIPFASKSSIILFLMTGADHHHVYFRLSEWLGGARLPLCSKGSHHPVSASEKRGLASSHRQPLQRHSVRFCLGSQLQLLERCLPPSCLPPIHACRTTSVWQS